jgi:hypothetical protein
MLSPDCKAWVQEPGVGLNDPLFTSARWQVVVMHVALLDSKTHEPYGARGKFQAERNAWVKLLYEHGVDLVMQAHVHYFRVHVSTLYKTQVDYVTVGNAGAPEIEVPPLSAGGGYIVGQRIQPGYVIVNFGGDSGTLTPYFCDPSGTRWTTGPRLTIRQH